MKKRLFSLFFAVFLLFLFSSCAKDTPAPHIPTPPVESTVTILTENGEITARFCMTDNENGSYTVLSPESIADTVFSLKDGVYTASTGELSVEYPVQFLPDGGALFDIFSLEGEPLEYAVTEEGTRYTVESYIEETRNFLFFFKDGQLVRLIVEGNTPLTVYFDPERKDA